MAVDLILVPKEHSRELRKITAGPILPPGSIIYQFAISAKDKRINRELIISILEKVGLDVGGNVIHKVVLMDRSEFYVDDAGKDLLD